MGCIVASVVPQAGAISNLRTTAATMSLVSTSARLRRESELLYTCLKRILATVGLRLTSAPDSS
jgi:hypothetical protein